MRPPGWRRSPTTRGSRRGRSAARPGVRSARYAGPEATDEENLDLLLAELAGAADRSVAYVCVLAYVDESGAEHLVEGRCSGQLALEPRGSGGFGYDPAFVPDDTEPGDPRTMAELSAEEKHAISHRGRAARRARRLAGGRIVIRTKSGAATLSVASNALLIALKIAAGAITGSIAILTEAAHSSIDLVASVIALISVRKADEPPDREHPYGHEKVENLAAAIEGMLILIGAGIIVFEATRRLVDGGQVEHLGVGIAVIGFSAVANLAVSGYLGRRAREHRSAALAGDAAHLRADALTSIGVLVGLGLVAITGVDAFDPIAALVVAAAIVFAGLRILTGSSRVLMDEAPPPEELDRIEAAIAGARPPEMVGYHKLRARRAGAREYIDLHVQFRSGTTLEHAHSLAHGLRDAIQAEVPDSDVLDPRRARGGGTRSRLARRRRRIGPDSGLSAPARRERRRPWRASKEVDRRREAHGAGDDRVARISVEERGSRPRSRRRSRW